MSFPIDILSRYALVSYFIDLLLILKNRHDSKKSYKIQKLYSLVDKMYHGSFNDSWKKIVINKKLELYTKYICIVRISTISDQFLSILYSKIRNILDF